MNSQHSEHWARQKERGTPFVLTLSALLVRYLPAWLMGICTHLIVLYFYLTSSRQRYNIARYQQRLKTAYPQVCLPQRLPVFRQFAAFGKLVCDRLAVWQGKIRYEDLIVEDPDDVYALVRKRGERGQIFVCSHLGNVEVCRALVNHHQGFKLNVLVHNRHAETINSALRKLGADQIQLVQVPDLDAAKMLELSRKIEAGEWIAIAADRVPVRGEKIVEVDFLGTKAEMPQGAWLLASLLKTRVNALFCIRHNGRYHLKFRRFLDNCDWKRGERQEKVAESAQRFARLLEEECVKHPLQWFNFYDFWKDDERG